MVEHQTGNSNGKRTMRRALLVISIYMTALLAVLSVIGAFLGAKRAAKFFGSIPLLVFWSVFIIVICLGFVFIKRLRSKPPLLMSHLGCVLVIIGAMWGSENAHKIRAKFFGSNQIHGGYLQIYEGQQTGDVIRGDGSDWKKKLPFEVKLIDFWIEYYEDPGFLEITTATGLKTILDSDIGEEYSPDGDITKLLIVKVFENCKIILEEGGYSAVDYPGDGVNPALEIKLTMSDGTSRSHYVFSRAHAGHDFSYGGLKLVYHAGKITGIKDFKSELVIIDNNKEVKKKIIEVNKPLHYRGYDFYQSDYDQDEGRFTVLSVSSNSGLLLVYAGYLMLTVGIILQYWLKLIPIKKRSNQ